jgi:hypothetical protein
MHLRPLPKSGAEIRAPVLIGQRPPSQDSSVLPQRNDAPPGYSIAKPKSDSVSLMWSKGGSLIWSAPVIAFTPPVQVHNGIQVLEANDGGVEIVFHLRSEGPGDYRSRPYEVYHTSIKNDGGWTEPRLVVSGYVGSIRSLFEDPTARPFAG